MLLYFNVWFIHHISSIIPSACTDLIWSIGRFNSHVVFNSATSKYLHSTGTVAVIKLYNHTISVQFSMTIIQIPDQFCRSATRWVEVSAGSKFCIQMQLPGNDVINQWDHGRCRGIWGNFNTPNQLFRIHNTVFTQRMQLSIPFKVFQNACWLMKNHPFAHSPFTALHCYFGVGELRQRGFPERQSPTNSLEFYTFIRLSHPRIIPSAQLTYSIFYLFAAAWTIAKMSMQRPLI